MASTTDYFQKLGGSSSLVNTPKVTATRSAAGTTLTVDNCNWDQTTGKIFATYQVDTSGAVVSGTEIIWTGVVNSTTSIGSLTRLAGASDSGSAIGDYVELLPASLWGNKLVSGLLVEHNQNGTHGAVTASSLTTSGNASIGGTLTSTGILSLPSVNKTTDANGWTVYNYGGWKEYVKLFGAYNPGATSASSTATLATSLSFPSGVAPNTVNIQHTGTIGGGANAAQMVFGVISAYDPTSSSTSYTFDLGCRNITATSLTPTNVYVVIKMVTR